MSGHKVKVAISIDFMDAFANIPQSEQKKVRRFLERFREHPTSSGINYEKIQNSLDPHLYSIRIDRKYRGIVKKPQNGKVYLLLWVDKHDKAYEWAERKKITINPNTGSVQVLTVEEDVVKEKPQVEAKVEPLFTELDDKELKNLGIPRIYLQHVKAIENEYELEQAKEFLPAEAFESLFFFKEGFAYDEILQAQAEEPLVKGAADIEDYENALEHIDSKRRFVVAEDAKEFAEILNYPLEKWRIFLHPIQRKIVEKDVNGPIRVLGGAGTGKTVVAMHRANWLLENIYTEENDRILFTTFTKNLTADLRENLKKICEPKIFDRIKVINLDKWITDFLKENSFEYTIEYNGCDSEAWSQALDYYEGGDFDNNFIRSEFEKIILEYNVRSFKQYIRTPRIGRGKRISRGQRKDLWPVFEEYRRLLEMNNKKERIDAFRDAKGILEQKGDILPYRTIIVDEAQDFGNAEFELIRQMIPESRSKDELRNDIFIVGDAHQRIYGNQVILSHCGIEIRGRSHRLKINYRTSEENKKWAIKLLKGEEYDDLDAGRDSHKGYRSLFKGEEPTIKNFDHYSDEINFIVDRLNKYKDEGIKMNSICLVARTKNLLQQYKNELNENEIETYKIRRGKAEDRSKAGVRIATMHRVKGIEFDYVFVVAVNDGIMPLNFALENVDSELAKHEKEKMEKSLLYVAATRARKKVYVTNYGNRSKFVKD